jgi:N-succinyldiaminopimelate aminotransferase
VFGKMSGLATSLGAINLGQGFPDTDGPDEIKGAAIRAISEGRGNQYPPVHGVPALRNAISEHQQRFYGLAIDPETQVVVGTGASEILQAALLALIDTDDEVIMFDPYFDIYAVGVDFARGKRVSVRLDENLRPDISRLEAAITPRTKLLLLNSPHNPSGVVFSRAELSAIADVAIKHNLIVLSDEAYEHLWYDDAPHIPIATLPEMFERTITVGSAGKSFSFTGWKVGWASGPADLIGAVRVARQHLSYVSSGPFQWAIAEGLALPDSYWESFRSDLQAKRDLLTNALTDLGFGIVPSQGTYFLTTDIRPLGKTSSTALAEQLAHEAGVVAIPVSALADDKSFGESYLRWAYCKQPATLEAAINRLTEWSAKA